MTDRDAHYENIRSEFARIGPVRLLGMKVGELSPGRAVLTLDAHDGLLHDFGVHGGVLATLADTAAAAAVLTEMPLADRLATIEMKINFLSVHREGLLRAEGTVLRRGKTLAVAEAEITNQDGEKIAKSLLTFSVRGNEDFPRDGQDR